MNPSEIVLASIGVILIVEWICFRIKMKRRRKELIEKVVNIEEIIQKKDTFLNLAE